MLEFSGNKTLYIESLEHIVMRLSIPAFYRSILYLVGKALQKARGGSKSLRILTLEAGAEFRANFFHFKGWGKRKPILKTIYKIVIVIYYVLMKEQFQVIYLILC